MTDTTHLHEAIKYVLNRGSQIENQPMTLRDRLALTIGYLSKEDSETAELLDRLLNEKEHGTVHSNNRTRQSTDG